nr:mechanosensitive ion channel family protein [Bacteroidota bacterium]
MAKIRNNLIDFFSRYPEVKYFIIAVVVFLIAVLISNMLRSAMNRYLNKSTRKLDLDPTKVSFFKNAASFIIFLVAGIIVFYSIPPLRALGLTLFAGAGIFTAILALASQQAFSNIISGIFIVIFQPYRVGDVIKVGELHMGKVMDITLRHTVINNFENRRIIIPNTVISSETIVNSSIDEPEICSFIEVGISYDSDIDLAMKIMQEEALRHPSCIDKRTAEDKSKGLPVVAVRLLSYGDSSINLRAWVWAEDTAKAFLMKCDLLKSIKDRFDAEGVEIPFPYRTIVFKNDLPKNVKSENNENTSK